METENVDAEQSLDAIHLFAGAGGGILGGCLLGWRTVCAVEIDQFCRELLVARQNDGTLPPFPIWDDVRTFDGSPWKGRCDVLCGGFPCQNISPLGDRKGILGEKSSLWFQFARIIGEVRPKWVFVENSSDLVKLGLDIVLRDLDALGYDAEWTCMAAAELGAPHVRDRVWVLAKAVRPELQEGAFEPGKNTGRAAGREGREASYEGVQVLADSDKERLQELWSTVTTAEELHTSELPREGHEGRNLQSEFWKDEPGIRRVANGVANQVERLMALGNGQVPQVAARAFRVLKARFAQ